MNIYVPSYQRHQKALVTRRLPSPWRETAKVVVVSEEAEAYTRAGYSVLVCPLRGIAPTRQWILEYAHARGQEVIVMLDDDLRFATRQPDRKRFVSSTNLEMLEMFLELDLVMQDHAHGAIRFRETANHWPDPHLINHRMLRALAYRPKVLVREGVRFDRLRYMEDFDVTLQLLELGYDSCSINDWVQDQTTSSDEGGCSAEGRTPEAQAAAAFGLWDLHQDFVRVVKKKAPKGPAWEGFGERTDVNIQWKKARASAREDRHV